MVKIRAGQWEKPKGVLVDGDFAPYDAVRLVGPITIDISRGVLSFNIEYELMGHSFYEAIFIRDGKERVEELQEDGKIVVSTRESTRFSELWEKLSPITYNELFPIVREKAAKRLAEMRKGNKSNSGGERS